jgi:hypothetical protein
VRSHSFFSLRNQGSSIHDLARGVEGVSLFLCRARDFFGAVGRKIDKTLVFCCRRNASLFLFFPLSSPSLPLSHSPMMVSLAPTGPHTCVGARNATGARSTALTRVAGARGGSGDNRRLCSRTSRSFSSSSSSTKTRAASDPPPVVSKTSYSAPTDAAPNADDDEDLVQYPDRERWVRAFFDSFFPLRRRRRREPSRRKTEKLKN